MEMSCPLRLVTVTCESFSFLRGLLYELILFIDCVMCVLPCVYVSKSEVAFYVLEVVNFLGFMFSSIIFSC